MLRPHFVDRRAAGRALAHLVLNATTPPSVVLGIPHGGVAVAAPVAALLAAPFSVVWVQKIVSRDEPEVAIGAVDLNGDVTLATETVRAEGLSDDEVAELAHHAHQFLLHEWERTPGLDPTALLPGATAILVDDGLCTGLTLRAAMRWVRRQFARKVVLAVPVVDQRIWRQLCKDADRCVTLEAKDEILAPSDVYDDHRRLSHDEMSRLLLRESSDLGAP